MNRTAHVYCGNFVGPPHWHGLEYYEPDECDWEGDVPLPEAPEEDELASFVCPGCGMTNQVRDHSCENRFVS